MKAAVLHEPNTPLTIETVDLDGPRDEELRIQVAASGLCHTDHHFMIGDMPHPLPVVLGHEAAGVVTAVGRGVSAFKVGDTVVTALTGFCGACTQCETGRNYRCDSRPARPAEPGSSRLSMGGAPVYQFGELGGFAEEMVVHQNYAARTPRDMPLDLAALLGCGVLTGVGAAFNTAGVRPGDSVAVVGCGGVGLNVIQGARIAGAARIIAVDLVQSKLDLARSLGATDVVKGGPNAHDEIQELTKGGVDHAFEVIGHPSTVKQAFLSLGKGGALTLVGVMRYDANLEFPPLPFFRNDVSVRASFIGSEPFRVGLGLFLSRIPIRFRPGRR